MYGLSNGEDMFYPRWPLKVEGQGQTLQTLTRISRKRYEIERKCQWKLDRKSCMGFRMVKKI